MKIALLAVAGLLCAWLLSNIKTSATVTANTYQSGCDQIVGACQPRSWQSFFPIAY
jgi:hypothetical protein